MDDVCSYCGSEANDEEKVNCDSDDELQCVQGVYGHPPCPPKKRCTGCSIVMSRKNAETVCRSCQLVDHFEGLLTKVDRQHELQLKLLQEILAETRFQPGGSGALAAKRDFQHLSDNHDNK